MNDRSLRLLCLSAWFLQAERGFRPPKQFWNNVNFYAIAKEALTPVASLQGVGVAQHLLRQGPGHPALAVSTSAPLGAVAHGVCEGNDMRNRDLPTQVLRACVFKGWTWDVPERPNGPLSRGRGT